MLFLAGIPGQIASLLARLTNSTVPLNDTRVGYLNAAIDSRASQSSVTTISGNVDSIKTKVDTNLDVLVSSVKVKAPASMTPGNGTWANWCNSAPGPAISAPALTANVFSTDLVNISGGGFLKFCLAYRGYSAANCELTTRLIIDGVTIDFAEGSSTSSDYYGRAAVGYFHETYGCAFDLVRFNSSLKIQVRSSAGQTSGKVQLKSVYQVDA